MARDRELPPPLEMMCLNALWELGEGNVEDVRKLVSQDRPLAYTTVLTLLDRLTRRDAVSRRKEGRGFRYQPTVDRNKLRRISLKLLLELHFENSAAKLRLFLDEPVTAPQAEEVPQTMAASVGSRLPDSPHPASGQPDSQLPVTLRE